MYSVIACRGILAKVKLQKNSERFLYVCVFVFDLCAYAKSCCLSLSTSFLSAFCRRRQSPIVKHRASVLGIGAVGGVGLRL